jgi:adenine-specific DNA-methyltransferase
VVDDLQIHNRKYLGAKHRLLPFIEEVITGCCSRIGVFVDAFSGTGVVANRFLGIADQVVANDFLYSNYITNRAFLEVLPGLGNPSRLRRFLLQLNELPPSRGYVTAAFGDRYFTIENAARIDTCREAICEASLRGTLSSGEVAVALTSLLYAADKVANSAGQYDAFLNNLGQSSYDQEGRHRVDSSVYSPLALRMPATAAGRPATVLNRETNEITAALAADVLYLDPPYNSRQYVDLYHVLENIALWSKPAVHGKTRKFDRSHLRSAYSRRSTATKTLHDLLEKAHAHHIFLSYNSEGIIPDQAIRAMLERKGRVRVFETDYGVFGNGAGRSRKRTVKERLFYCRA